MRDRSFFKGREKFIRASELNASLMNFGVRLQGGKSWPTRSFAKVWVYVLFRVGEGMGRRVLRSWRRIFSFSWKK